MPLLRRKLVKINFSEEAGKRRNKGALRKAPLFKKEKHTNEIQNILILSKEKRYGNI